MEVLEASLTHAARYFDQNVCTTLSDSRQSAVAIFELTSVKPPICQSMLRKNLAGNARRQ